MTEPFNLASAQWAPPLACSLHALCAMLATGCCEASRTWRDIEEPVRVAFGSAAEPLAFAMRASDGRAAFSAAEALAATAEEMA